MKKTTQFATVIGLVLSFTFITAYSVFAEDVSAPQIVAPAQPAAGGANVVGGATHNTGAATTGIGTAPTAAAPQQQGGMFQMMLPLLVMLGVMYFIAIRPQQKKMKQHQALLGGLQNGDEVITNSGIIGTITGMSDKVVNLEVSKNVQIKVLKSQVNQVVKGSIQEILA